jgi:hypothetical protein
MMCSIQPVNELLFFVPIQHLSLKPFSERDGKDKSKFHTGQAMSLFFPNYFLISFQSQPLMV